VRNLHRILKLLNNVDYVTRPLGEEDQQVALSFPEEEAMQGSNIGQPPSVNPAQKPLNTQAFDNIETGLDLDRRGDMTPPGEPEAEVMSPARKKLKYLDLMNQNQKNKFPEMKPIPTLAGGSRGLRI
jgi:hypothetical protein